MAAGRDIDETRTLTERLGALPCPVVLVSNEVGLASSPPLPRPSLPRPRRAAQSAGGGGRRSRYLRGRRPSPHAEGFRHVKIPATIVTGFLGAGKTSLIRHLLAEPDGRRLR